MVDISARRRRLITLFMSGGTSYRLQDLFTTALAAGSVNGTLAEPSGQTRTVTDTNSKLSITGGVVSVVTGGVGAGDPGLWYPSMTRVLGLSLIASFIQTTNVLEIGWDVSASGSILICLRSVIGTSLAVRDNGTAIVVSASLSSATSYQTSIVLRLTGAWYFIKGGVFIFWILIWVSVLDNGNRLPGFANGSSTDVYTVDNIRIPTTLYIPTPLAYDTFTRVDSALGATETTSPDSVTIAPLTWLFTVSIWAVATNKAVGTPTLGGDVIVNGVFAADTDWTKGSGWTIAAGVAAAVAASSDLSQTVAPLTAGLWYSVTYTVSAFAAGTVQAVVGGVALPTHAANGTYTEIARAGTTAFLIRGAGFTGSIDNVIAKPLTTAELSAGVLTSTADVIVDATITLSGATAGLPSGLWLNVDNVANPQNFVLVYLDGKGNCVIEECVAGVFATKQTTAITYSAGAVLRASRSGTECRAFYNNAAVGSAQTMTANTNKNHNIFSASPLNSVDNVTIWAKGTSGEYAALDGF